MSETTFEKIQRKTGRKPTNCKCNLCKAQCKNVGLGTPEDIKNLINAGYGARVMLTVWGAGVRMGLMDTPIEIIAPMYDKQKGCCTFFTDGVCELHNLGLKPTECKLSHHTLQAENFNARKSLSWNVIKEWLDMPAEKIQELQNLNNEN